MSRAVSRQGLTLIELLVVISIISILVALLLSAVQSSGPNEKDGIVYLRR